jgi:D-aminoacyl-tRNA deacylase
MSATVARRMWRCGRDSDVGIIVVHERDGATFLPGSGAIEIESIKRNSHSVRVLLQRVSRAEVRVDRRVVGNIGIGYCLLVGFTQTDTEAQLVWMADKIAGLRILADDAGKMNLSLADVGGAVLVISQFTLYGDASAGRRPSFLAAAPGPIAEPLYETFIAMLRERGCRVESGVFGAMSEVDLVNDGPTTIWLER